MPHTIVEVGTPHPAPDVHHTIYGGFRIVQGKSYIRWSDGAWE